MERSMQLKKLHKYAHQNVILVIILCSVTAMIVINLIRLFSPVEAITILKSFGVQLTSSKISSTVGGFLDCDKQSMLPSPTEPDDVNKVRPADIKSIGALGDSMMIGCKSKNFIDEGDHVFVGNSFVTGADERLEQHATIANILRKFNPNLAGISRSFPPETYNFNVGFNGASSNRLPKQAKTLVKKYQEHEGQYFKSWKLIFIFIGTNDLGYTLCLSGSQVPTTKEDYKSNIEKSISILRRMPKTIIALIPMWHPRVVIEARHLIDRMNEECWSNETTTKIREKLSRDYAEAAYEIQNERIFESKNFAVVVQGFMDELKEPITDKNGEFNKKFYADDLFHLSKYGNAVIALHLWNCLLEPVGKKNRKADLSDDFHALQCPKEPLPYIRTLGNS